MRAKLKAKRHEEKKARKAQKRVVKVKQKAKNMAALRKRIAKRNDNAEDKKRASRGKRRRGKYGY